MKATELLREQHREVADLFQRAQEAGDADEKASLFDELVARLVAHDVIERAIFYPACEAEMGMSALLDEAMVEHGVIEFSLHVAHESLGGAGFDARLAVLKEMVEHHVKEEEKDLFPAVERAFTARQLEELGAGMKDRFENALLANTGALLRANLREVLGDTTEPLPPLHGATPRRPASQTVARITLKAPAKTARSAT